MSTAPADNLPVRSSSLVVRFSQRFGIEPNKMLETLKQTAFKTDKPATNEQMMALLVVAEQYNLNPFTKELFAFVDKTGGIVPSVSVDGWARIVNEHPQYDGSEFHFTPDEGGEMTCTMYRKDRSHATVLTEYMSECKRSSIPWQQTPRRMLRHRAFIQAARLTFGFAGIYGDDEARQIVNMGSVQYADEETIDPETGEITRPVSDAAQRARDAVRSKMKGKQRGAAATAAGPVQDVTPRAAEDLAGQLPTLDELIQAIATVGDRVSAQHILSNIDHLDAEEQRHLMSVYEERFPHDDDSEHDEDR
jgi:RecT family